MRKVNQYQPHPKQRILHESPANEILFGGAAGPGKSHALRQEAARWCGRIPNLHVYLFRRTFPELEKTHILKSLEEFPRSHARYCESPKRRWEWWNGSKLFFCHCQHEKDVFDFQGAEIHLLLIDELTHFSEFQYDYLRGRVRCTLAVPAKWAHKIPGIVCASNPGGLGHQWVKRRWVTFADPMECKRAPAIEGGMLRQYIPAVLEDNPTLLARDPGYEARLDGLPEPYRTAYRQGRWDVFAGQMFAFDEKYHVIDPLPIPDGAPMMMTYDYGFGKPYSIGWWWWDEDGRLYRVSEIYGCAEGQIDVGLRQTDEEVVEIVKAHEEANGYRGRPMVRLCDPTCFNQKPRYVGGGQGPSTAEVWARMGLRLRPADANRRLKIRQFHARLRLKFAPAGGPLLEPPMLLVYRGCEAFRRTIPALSADLSDPEDVDTKQEDHCYDEAAQACMARPLSMGDAASRIVQEGARDERD